MPAFSKWCLVLALWLLGACFLTELEAESNANAASNGSWRLEIRSDTLLYTFDPRRALLSPVAPLSDRQPSDFNAVEVEAIASSQALQDQNGNGQHWIEIQLTQGPRFFISSKDVITELESGPTAMPAQTRWLPERYTCPRYRFTSAGRLLVDGQLAIGTSTHIDRIVNDYAFLANPENRIEAVSSWCLRDILVTATTPLAAISDPTQQLFYLSAEQRAAFQGWWQQFTNELEKMWNEILAFIGEHPDRAGEISTFEIAFWSDASWAPRVHAIIETLIQCPFAPARQDYLFPTAPGMPVCELSTEQMALLLRVVSGPVLNQTAYLMQRMLGTTDDLFPAFAVEPSVFPFSYAVPVSAAQDEARAKSLGLFTGSLAKEYSSELPRAESIRTNEIFSLPLFLNAEQIRGAIANLTFANDQEFGFIDINHSVVVAGWGAATEGQAISYEPIYAHTHPAERIDGNDSTSLLFAHAALSSALILNERNRNTIQIAAHKVFSGQTFADLHYLLESSQREHTVIDAFGRAVTTPVQSGQSLRFYTALGYVDLALP